MKRILLILVAMFALVMAAPAAAHAWSFSLTPTSIEKFGYGTGTGHTTTGNSTWSPLAVYASDGGIRSNVGQVFTPSANGFRVQWSDGASVGATEKIMTDSDLRMQFQYGTSGKAVGTYSSTYRLSHTGATPTTADVALKAYVQPWNQCTDGLDNDSDGLRDWKKGAGGSTANADTDCLDMNDTTEGGGALTPPATPSNVTCVYKSGQIDVSWTDNANNETEQYVHTQVTSNGGLGQDLPVGANTTSKSVTTNLLNGSQFDSWVNASNAAGGSSSAQTSYCRGMPLATPGGVDATSVDTDTINVVWTDIAGETGYTLQRDTASSFPSPTNITLAANTASYTDNAVTGDGTRTYYYRVKPTRTGQATDVTSAFDGTTPPPPDTGVSPTAPVAISGVANSSTAITATWDDNATTETGYEVQRDTNSGFTSPTSVTKAAGATSHQFTGLTASTAYYLRVRALCSPNCVASAWTTISAPVSTPGTPAAPTAPSGPNANSISSTEINVGWTDASNDETSFELQRSTSSTFTSPVTITKGANVTAHADTGLTASTQYFYRVRAVNSVGNSAYSATASATTQAAGGGGSWWKPTANVGQWYWQLSDALNTNNANTVNILDTDPDLVTAAQISTWKANRVAAGGNPKAICYVSAGTAENFRADYQQFLDIDQARRAAGDSNGILGGVLPEWQDERWLDGEDFQYFQHLIAARVDQCVADGFDAVEFDNMDGYTNDPATLTASEQLTYNRALASLAHSKNLGVFLKNDVDQLTALQPDFDGAINEQCNEFGECGGYSVFLNANKPVFQAEYQSGTGGCASAVAAGRNAIYRDINLTAAGRYVKC